MRAGLTLVALCALGSACTNNGAASNETASMLPDNSMMIDDMTADNMTAVDTPKTGEQSGGWSYTEKKDEMRGGTRKMASVSALEPVSLGAPYGETTPELNIRRDPKFGFNIFFTSEGQPLCRSYRDDTISMKFDSGKIHEWSCSESSDGSPGVVFFNREQSLLALLKKSKKVTMEINYYDNGRQQITFPVEGLKW